MSTVDDLLSRHWDVIVIGAGMSGATLGHALARAGKSVLFLEQGISSLADAAMHRGEWAESLFPRREVPRPKHRATLQATGRWWEEIEDVSLQRSRRFIPFVGAGAGGSSALYGMALERFFPADFTPRRHHANAPDAELPEAWPISYEDFEPYYARAERLYRVRGSADPLKAAHSGDALAEPPPLLPASAELQHFLGEKGLHPYQLPLACEDVPGCMGCQGYLCARDCKNDSARICLAPALALHGAALLDRCQVLRLEASRDAVTHAVCVREGRSFKLQADTFVLAAGAMATPALLLRSASAAWPQGLANDSGLVGRFLMRHFVDLYPVFLKSAGSQEGNAKQLAFNDFYLRDGLKLGSVQSFGPMPPAAVLVAAMMDDLRHGPFGRVAWAVGLAAPLLRPVLGGMFSRATVLASVLEDMPYRDNRVSLAQSGEAQANITLSYRIRDYDRLRIRLFRERIQAALKPYRFMLIKQAENNQRIAHVCGTCRFGLDAGSSVLNGDNRAHAVGNLYVVDASFFPSSGGTNPALTLAANALRVADRMIAARD